MTYLFCSLGLLFALWGSELAATAMRIQSRMEERTQIVQCVAIRTLQLRHALTRASQVSNTMHQMRAKLAAAPSLEMRRQLEALASKGALDWESARASVPPSCEKLQEDWERWNAPPPDVIGPQPPELLQRARQVCEMGHHEVRCGQLDTEGGVRWL